MSIKTKLALIISLIVTVILVLNNGLYYASTRDMMIEDQQKQMELVAKEVQIMVEHSRVGSKYVEDLIGQDLRTAALVAESALDPKAENVTNDELRDLAAKIGISEITLFQRRGDDIVGVKSSDPNEINLSTKEWGYWYDAFKELLDKQNVDIPEGQKLQHYWSGPIDVSSSDPDSVDKWGYYYDGTTDYIINPYVRDEHILTFDQLIGPQPIIEKTLQHNGVLLEITGFNPKAFGKPPILTKHNGQEYVELGDRPVFFGPYDYKEDKRDVQSVQNAYNVQKRIGYTTTVNGTKVIKSFIPVNDKDQPYVLGVVTDYKVIQDALNQQLLRNTLISIALLVVVFCASFYLAGFIVRPVKQILDKVNQMAEGDFTARIPHMRRDELGLLADRMNVMSNNLQTYTEALEYKQEQIQYQAFHDKLTGLANRRLFTRTLTETLEASDGTRSFAVMFFDLDRFKLINETYGHNTGDRVLEEVAARVQSCVGDIDMVARLGGDEFTVLLRELEEVAEAEQVAQSIIEILSKPFVVNHHELFVNASVGIAVHPQDGDDMDTLLKRADRAMFEAKSMGGNNHQVYNPDMATTDVERVTLENHLRKAIDRDELVLHFQPKVDIQTGDITGMETLIRWVHPELGFISPGTFIPLAEESGLILPISDWVLKTACRQNKAWQDAGFAPMRVAVNLSARQFQHRNLVESVVQALSETKLDPQWLELEITETILMENMEEVISTLEELREMGITIAIDDFGTGYSSLSYLKKFPIDSLKIDRSFVQDITDAEEDAQIARAIITLGHSLQLNVVAEGVETAGQLEFLRENGCDEMQGFYFSKPLPADEFANLLLARKREITTTEI
ncbi:MAG TPA: EAL domain-containing protein [Bacilli bacterium]|nr:EAL domain-containing protein [Bacilli bacterium]